MDDLLNPGENVVELLLFNSHDRTKSFSISTGIFRFVCSHGFVVADSVFKTYKIKHLGYRDNEVANAVSNITAIKGTLINRIKKLSTLKI